MYRFVSSALLLSALLSTAACGDDAAPTAPTPASPVTVSETFSGSINRNGAATHTFLAQAAGTGLEDHEVQVEERLETNEKGEKLVGCYRLDTGERYSTRYANAADMDAAAQVRLRWGRP